MDSEKEITLSNALGLLKKVLSVGETNYDFEDWQMLQVAQFLVSKEKVLLRDDDNTTLHFASDLSFYYIEDLCERVYALAKYICFNCAQRGSQLVIDQTKRVHYLQDIPTKYKMLTNPTFEEALILVNMVRNSIAHNQSKIDFESSMLKVDNKMLKKDGSGDTQFEIHVDIPISLLSDLDYGRIVHNNNDKLMYAVFDAIRANNYTVEDGKVNIIIEFNNCPHEVTLPTEIFMMFEYAYENYSHRIPAKSVETLDIVKRKKSKLTLVRESRAKSAFFSRKNGKNSTSSIYLNTLNAILTIIDLDNNKCLDSKIVTQFLAIINSNALPRSITIKAMDHFNNVLTSLNFQKNTEETLSSMSLALGVSKEKKSIDFIALYNFMIMLYSNYPLKEGNRVLTEFIDLSDFDVSYTNDRDLITFYKDVENIIVDFMENFISDPVKYEHQRPCIDLYAKTIMSIMAKLKTRNNALIRHIRNAVDHSGVDLVKENIIFKDNVVDGEEVELTFRGRGRIIPLAKMSFDYFNIYDIVDFPTYCSTVSNPQTGLEPYTYALLFKELKKGISPEVLVRFMNALNEIHSRALEEAIDFSEPIAGVPIKLGREAERLRKERRSKGGPGPK